MVNAADAALLQHTRAAVQREMTATQQADEAYRCLCICQITCA